MKACHNCTVSSLSARLLKNIVNYLAVFIVFSSAFTFFVMKFAEFRLMYVIILFMFLLFLPLVRSIPINKYFVIVFCAICVSSVFNVVMGNNTFSLFAKQLIGISGNAIFFYYLVYFNKYDIKKLFIIYLNIAFIVAVIGIVQEVSYLMHFEPGYNFLDFLPLWKTTVLASKRFIRVNSIFAEPAHFCHVMSPALFTALATLFERKKSYLSWWKCIIIILAYVFTFSLTGYVLIAISSVILFKNSRYANVRNIFIIILIIGIFGGVFYARCAHELKYRLRDTYEWICGDKNIEDTNISTYAFASNFLVAVYVMEESPLWGHGLGSHAKSYEKYVGTLIPESNRPFGSNLNKNDAASLFSRLISETGMMGVAIFFLYIIFYWRRMTPDEKRPFWIINRACFMLFVSKLIKFSHYFADGFFFFFWLYYFSYLEGKKEPLNIICDTPNDKGKK